MSGKLEPITRVPPWFSKSKRGTGFWTGVTAYAAHDEPRCVAKPAAR